jgi:hypothetical protein
LVAAAGHFTSRPFFEIADASEREPVAVEIGTIP